MGQIGRARPTADRILEAACEIFAGRGFQQSTMEAIAERAATTKPTVYAHFGDKDALYRSVLARESAALGDWVTTAYEAAAGLAIEQQVRVYVMALFNYATARPASFRLLFESPVEGAGAGPRRELVEVITRSVAAQIRRYLDDRGRPAGVSADLVATLLVTMVGRAAEWSIGAEGLDPQAAGNLTCGLVVGALHGVDPELLAAIDRA
jgi:AcrR family transcriptional regulator